MPRTDDVNALDLDAHYSVGDQPGAAFYLLGYVERDTPDSEWTGERTVDYDWVHAVMVGDDRVHEIETNELTLLDEDDFCHECGQIGCEHDGRVRDWEWEELRDNLRERAP